MYKTFRSRIDVKDFIYQFENNTIKNLRQVYNVLLKQDKDNKAKALNLMATICSLNIKKPVLKEKTLKKIFRFLTDRLQEG